MSNLLLDYLNEEIKLSKPIKNIEKDFSNGYYFAELFEKIGYLNSDLKKYKKEPKTDEEIKNNFNNLKLAFNNIGIHFDDEIINLIMNSEKNIASNIIYKIRTKMTRKKINFDDIMSKINISYKKLEEMKERNKKFMKSSMNFFKRDSKILLKSKSSNNFSDFSGLTNYQNPSKINLLSTEKENKKIKLKPIKKNKNKKVHLPIKKEEKKIKEITEELSQNLEYTNKTRNKKIENKENELSIKNNINSTNQSLNEYLNYLSFENNSFKLGLNMQEKDLKLKKYIIGSNNLIETKIVKTALKKKLSENKKVKEKTLKQKDIEDAIKNSVLKNIEKPFVLKVNKPYYKMSQYEKERKKKFPTKTKEQIEEIKKNKLFNTTFNINSDINNNTTNNWYKTSYMNFGKLKKDLSLSPKEYIKSLSREEIIDTKIKNEIKRKKKELDLFDIEEITKLILDITDEAYKFQNETKKEFINLPQYKNWIELFIEGKTCKKHNEMNNINIIKKDEDD